MGLDWSASVVAKEVGVTEHEVALAALIRDEPGAGLRMQVGIVRIAELLAALIAMLPGEFSLLDAED